jgi:hypothetical protein
MKKEEEEKGEEEKDEDEGGGEVRGKKWKLLENRQITSRRGWG